MLQLAQMITITNFPRSVAEKKPTKEIILPCVEFKFPSHKVQLRKKSVIERSPV